MFLRLKRVEKYFSSNKITKALKPLSLSIDLGQHVFVIGETGSGKSTLLKVLSQITSPTEGRFGYNGHLASLLEVGTGFHAELSGRENIFLNGLIFIPKRMK